MFLAGAVGQRGFGQCHEVGRAQAERAREPEQRLELGRLLIALQFGDHRHRDARCLREVREGQLVLLAQAADDRKIELGCRRSHFR
jgi:hypothetical protein